jgi:hypothetical protein
MVSLAADIGHVKVLTEHRSLGSYVERLSRECCPGSPRAGYSADLFCLWPMML